MKYEQAYDPAIVLQIVHDLFSFIYCIEQYSMLLLLT